MVRNFLGVVKAYAAKIKEEAKTPVVIVPSEVKSERFHLELSILPHPVILGNGRMRLRLRATVFAEIPSSDTAINDCLEKSAALALFFNEAQGFEIDREVEFYGIAFHKPLREDDELFSDLANEERSYSYNESWLAELEFGFDKITKK